MIRAPLFVSFVPFLILVSEREKWEKIATGAEELFGFSGSLVTLHISGLF